jgi:hypothetical protein
MNKLYQFSIRLDRPIVEWAIPSQLSVGLVPPMTCHSTYKVRIEVPPELRNKTIQVTVHSKEQ